jgi:hypothetical protein
MNLAARPRNALRRRAGTRDQTGISPEAGSRGTLAGSHGPDSIRRLTFTWQLQQFWPIESQKA